MDEEVRGTKSETQFEDDRRMDKDEDLLVNELVLEEDEIVRR